MTVSCWSVLNYASHDIYIYILFTSYAYSSMNTTRIVLQYRVQLVLCIREQQEKHLQYAYVSIKLDAKISKYTEYYQLVRASTTLEYDLLFYSRVCIACTIVRARIIYARIYIIRSFGIMRSMYAYYSYQLIVLQSSTSSYAYFQSTLVVCIQEVLCIIREYNITSQYYSQLEC